LLDRITHVKTSKCFPYNNTIIFAVPNALVSRAIGPGAINAKKLQEQLGKKIKIISEAQNPNEIEHFIKEIIAPLNFKSLEIKDNIIIINAGSQSKAALIGRNRRREQELQSIIKDNFSMDIKII
jgi:transcription antitermination factor NusA-like protein